MSEYDEAETQAVSLSALVNDDSMKVLEGDRRDLANQIQGLISQIRASKKAYQAKVKENFGGKLQTQSAKEPVPQPSMEPATLIQPAVVDEKDQFMHSQIEEIKQTSFQPFETPDPRIRQFERQVEELQFAVEIFKLYGFQPKQYDELMKTLK